MFVDVKYRRARREYQCSHKCGVPIKVGEMHEVTRLAPHSHPEVDHDHWETYRGHIAFCPDGSN